MVSAVPNPHGLGTCVKAREATAQPLKRVTLSEGRWLGGSEEPTFQSVSVCPPRALMTEDITGVKHDLLFIAGMFGVDQDPETRALAPPSAGPSSTTSL